MAAITTSMRYVSALLVAGLLSSALADDVHAWGHLERLRQPEGQGHLVFASLDRARIGYCSDSGTTDVGQQELDIQVESAIDIWLSEVENLLPRPVTVERDCDPQTLDVEIVLSPIDARPSSLGRHLIVPVGDRLVSKIWLNPAPVHEVPLVRTSIFDLAPHAADVEAKTAFLRRLRVGQKSLFDLVAEFELETPRPITSSLYQTLIHEMGHSFGLCDVNDVIFTASCDARFRTVPAPLAVMSIAGAINLTRDDRAGIVSLFRRFADRPDPAAITPGDLRPSATPGVTNIPGVSLSGDGETFVEF